MMQCFSEYKTTLQYQSVTRGTPIQYDIADTKNDSSVSANSWAWAGWIRFKYMD